MSKPFEIIVFVSGRGSNLKAIESAIEGGEIAASLTAVFSDKPNCEAVNYSISKGYKVEVIERSRESKTLEQFDHEIVAKLKQYRFDLIVLAGFMCVIGPQMIETYRGKIINIHPSLLPSFTGLKAQKQAVEAGVCFSGCTVHFVSEEVDAGAIIAQAVVPVLPEDTAQHLEERILKQEHILLPKTIKLFAEGEITVSVSGKSLVFNRVLSDIGAEESLISI